jgi:hypothetical protein
MCDMNRVRFNHSIKIEMLESLRFYKKYLPFIYYPFKRQLYNLAKRNYQNIAIEV